MKQSYLDDFDMMLSGYVPGAAALEAVGQIGQELKRKAQSKPGSFFWVLDPVMGDNGNLYVAPDVVPVYKSLVHHADLVLPNQFEAEYVEPLPQHHPHPQPLFVLFFFCLLRVTLLTLPCSESPDSSPKSK